MVASETALTRSLETTHPILLPPIGSQQPEPHARNPIVIGVRALCSRLEAQRRSAFSWPLGRLRGHYDHHLDDDGGLATAGPLRLA